MSFDSQNPYQSPDFKDLPPQFGAGYSTPGGISASMLTQQRVVAILMIVQGTMSLIMGIVLAVIAAVIPAIIAADMKRQAAQGGPPAEMMQTFMLTFYGAMAACGILAGLMQIIAGFQNIWLKGYVLGLIGLGSGVISFGTCYCLPTALALLIYGLIIYCHESTRLAFQLASPGQTNDEIMRQAVR
jgi:hypothetical protein